MCVCLYTLLLSYATFAVILHYMMRKTANISKLVGDAWKKLTPEEREPWEAMSREDRERFEREKMAYEGPWKVPKTRKIKHANAPKKPMSAFFAFASARRAGLTSTMIGASNGEISKTLATMWREAPEDVRQHYIADEKKKRLEYLTAIQIFRKEQEREEQVQKKVERLPQQAKKATRSRDDDDQSRSNSSSCESQTTSGMRQREEQMERRMAPPLERAKKMPSPPDRHVHANKSGLQKPQPGFHGSSPPPAHRDNIRNETANLHLVPTPFFTNGFFPSIYQPSPPRRGTSSLSRDACDELDEEERRDLLETFFCK